MSEVLFTADWHLKLGQKNVPASWARDRYNKLFNELHDIESGHQYHVIGGDIFDRLPSLEELFLFLDYVKYRETNLIIYDGNHEATKKNKTFFSILGALIDLVCDYDRDEYSAYVVTETQFLLEIGGTVIPYCDLHKKDSIEKADPNYAIYTHVRGAIPPHVQPEVDLSRFDKFPVVFAGDLHAHQNTQRNIVYPGSPVTTSFHREKVPSTGYISIKENFIDWEWHPFRTQFPQLIRKKVSSEEEMVNTTPDHTIYELEGDLQKLSKVKNSELLDKKLVKRNSEASLLLDNNMSVREELAEYLEFILELEPKTLDRVLNLFNDNSKETNLG